MSHAARSLPTTLFPSSPVDAFLQDRLELRTTNVAYSRSICGHRLKAHDCKPGGRRKCKERGCRCGNFFYIVAEGSWMLRCQCKHKGIEHDPNTRKCKRPNCKCNGFRSPWVCNCDHPWDRHEQREVKVSHFSSRIHDAFAMCRGARLTCATTRGAADQGEDVRCGRGRLGVHGSEPLAEAQTRLGLTVSEGALARHVVIPTMYNNTANCLTVGIKRAHASTRAANDGCSSARRVSQSHPTDCSLVHYFHDFSSFAIKTHMAQM